MYNELVHVCIYIYIYMERCETALAPSVIVKITNDDTWGVFNACY